MPDSPLSTKVIPRRGAAQRASAAIAQEALEEDSDTLTSLTSSEEEESDDNGRISKGKSRPRSKKQQGIRRKEGSGKGTSDKVAGSSATVGRTQIGQERDDMDTTPTMKRPSPTKTYKGAKRKRREAQKVDDSDGSNSSTRENVSPTVANDITATSVDQTSSPGKANPGLEKQRPKARPKPRLKTSNSDVPKPSGTPSAPDVSEAIASVDLATFSDESDLTPLSSPVEEAVVTAPLVPVSTSTSPKRLTNSDTASPRRKHQEHPMFKDAAQKAKPKPISKRVAIKHPGLFTESDDEKESWNARKLGKYVWVRLAGKYKAAEVWTSQSKGQDALWWPAHVRDVSLHALRCVIVLTRASTLPAHRYSATRLLGPLCKSSYCHCGL